MGSFHRWYHSVTDCCLTSQVGKKEPIHDQCDGEQPHRNGCDHRPSLEEAKSAFVIDLESMRPIAPCQQRRGDQSEQVCKSPSTAGRDSQLDQFCSRCGRE